MISQHASYHFKRLKRKYQWLRGTEIALWSLSISAVTFFTLKIFMISTGICIAAAVVLIVAIAIAGSRKLKLFTTRENDLALYINRHYPKLEESADLLLRDDDTLTSLQLLQKIKTQEKLDAIYPEIKLPHHLGRAIGVLFAGMIISLGLTAFSGDKKLNAVSRNIRDELDSVRSKYLPVQIKNALITISPPSYTKLKTNSVTHFDVSVPEGSSVQWEIIFNGLITKPHLIFSGRDTAYLLPSSNGYHFTETFREAGFYQLGWTNPDHSRHYSDYYKFDVIKDQPPIIRVENMDQFSELTFSDNLKINLTAILTDDYGLKKADIVATVSKGSGEAIKFREEKLEFEKPTSVTGKKAVSNRSLDLLKLGLQPGDELYFYVEAFDNKSPVANRSRTETYFISIQDTSSIVTSVDASLGVDLMPEYFRSQRQIIIDSEKLLKEKKNISKQNFNSRSNELGYDQKVLRLRYGEFLGEEFESGIGPQHEAPSSASPDEDIEKKFGHDHDKDNEHNLVPDKKSIGKDHDHGEEEDQKNPLKEFVHAHDNDEEATFFIQSIKAKLKAAVTIMWDAELYLRLYEPEKSLPFQYKALKLLKEISQDSRIYVHRTGFDPPPLKEDKRLTGDLAEIANSTSNEHLVNEEQYPHIRSTIQRIERLLQYDTIILSDGLKTSFVKAGQEVAGIALAQPSKYLKTLSLLKSITQNEVPIQELKSDLIIIRAALWNILPLETISPHAPSGSYHDLDRSFMKSLEAAKQNN